MQFSLQINLPCMQFGCSHTLYGYCLSPNCIFSNWISVNHFKSMYYQYNMYHVFVFLFFFIQNDVLSFPLQHMDLCLYKKKYSIWFWCMDVLKGFYLMTKVQNIKVFCCLFLDHKFVQAVRNIIYISAGLMYYSCKWF